MEKPRRTFGTPVYKIRNRFAFGVIAVGVALGVGYNISGLSTKLKKSIVAGDFNQTSQEIDRKNLMSVISLNRGATIKEKIELEREEARR